MHEVALLKDLVIVLGADRRDVETRRLILRVATDDREDFAVSAPVVRNHRVIDILAHLEPFESSSGKTDPCG